MDWEMTYRDIPEDEQTEVCDAVVNLRNQRKQVREWQQQAGAGHAPRTSSRLLKDYRGTKIDFEELEFGRKVGSGGFGDVYFAKWASSVVAVKKLRVQRVSKRRLKEFTDEIMLLCQLDHPRVVKFIGACVTTPNLCIVMEYMQISLFDALHIDDAIDFTDGERLDIIRQTAAGLEYLHANNIAHCDLKSMNVLLDFEAGDKLEAKITDFGLSMVKHEMETSSSSGHDRVRNIGTPRYSAPEVLRGEMLSLRAMKKADVYSYSLIVYEVVCEEEPFYKFRYAQLQREVGERGLLPQIPEEISLNFSLHRLLMDCWDRNPDDRPTAEQISNFMMECNRIYARQPAN